MSYKAIALQIGMPYTEACGMLGEPSDVVSTRTHRVLASLFASPKVFLDPEINREDIPLTKWAVWKRPEGTYMLVFIRKKLEYITRTPKG